MATLTDISMTYIQQSRLPDLDPRVTEALYEVVRKSLDRFTGCMVLNFQDGLVLEMETRTKRRLRKL